MFRLAQAYFGQGEFELAEEYIISASGIFPSDAAIQDFRKVVKDKLLDIQSKKDLYEQKPAEPKAQPNVDK